MDEKRDVLANYLVSRSYCYQMFSVLFAQEPKAEVLEMLVAKESRDILSFFLTQKVVSKFEKAVNFWNNASFEEREVWLSKASSEYTRLFLGPLSLLAPPWESVYLAESDILFQKSTLEVRNIYRSYGFERAIEGNEADDHLALELDFMHQLGIRSLEVLDNNAVEVFNLLKVQQNFLDAHLGKWVPLFVERMRRSGYAGLYLSATEILCEFIEVDIKLGAEAAVMTGVDCVG